jgi:hypothetical protein
MLADNAHTPKCLRFVCVFLFSIKLLSLLHFCFLAERSMAQASSVSSLNGNSIPLLSHESNDFATKEEDKIRRGKEREITKRIHPFSMLLFVCFFARG